MCTQRIFLLIFFPNKNRRIRFAKIIKSIKRLVWATKCAGGVFTAAVIARTVKEIRRIAYFHGSLANVLAVSRTHWHIVAFLAGRKPQLAFGEYAVVGIRDSQWTKSGHCGGLRRFVWLLLLTAPATKNRISRCLPPVCAVKSIAASRRLLLLLLDACIRRVAVRFWPLHA